MDEQHRTTYPEFDPEDVIDSVVIEHPGVTNDRSAARRVALQILYEVDSAGHALGLVLSQQIAYHKLNDKATRYLERLVTTVSDNITYLDTMIQQHAPEWPLEQIAIVDRNILRMAVTEFAVLEQVPVKVAIDEAVELAKLYGAESTPRFINGVLGSLAEDVDGLRAALRAARTADQPAGSAGPMTAGSTS